MVTKFPFLFLPPPLPVTLSAMHFHLAMGLDDFNDSALGVCSTVVVVVLHAHTTRGKLFMCLAFAAVVVAPCGYKMAAKSLKAHFLQT